MKPKKCRNKNCGKEFTPQFNSLEAFCSFPCAKEGREPDLKLKAVYKIPQVSKKRKVEQLQYQVLRTEFLSKPENKICFIEGCNRESNTIEHRAGRWGKNYLDTTTWAGCCSEHNIELENNPELAKKYQLSKIHGGSKL
jgi:hypothetical protein